jgi:hypothetical protein
MVSIMTVLRFTPAHSGSGWGKVKSMPTCCLRSYIILCVMCMDWATAELSHKFEC